MLYYLGYIHYIFGARKTLPNPSFKNKKNGLLSSDDLLTIKTGELLAKTEELQEVNQSLDILNGDLKKRIKELKDAKQDLNTSGISLLIANDKLAETNEKFASVNSYVNTWILLSCKQIMLV